jgi:transposase
MGRKPAPAARVCVTCKRRQSAAEFLPNGRKCEGCRAQDGGPVNPSAPDDQERAAARARGRALRRLALEYPEDYRAACQRRLRARPAGLSPRAARRWAVRNAPGDLANRHPERYGVFYREELARARSEPVPVRRGRPPGAKDQLAIGSTSFARTWRPAAQRQATSRPRSTGTAELRAARQSRRERAAALFAQGKAASAVAKELGVARQTATRWQARFRAGGAAALQYRTGRRPAIPDSQLPAIEQALRKGPAAHGLRGEVWTATQVAEVIQRLSGVRLTPSSAKRLLRDRLGWTVQGPHLPALVEPGDPGGSG